MMNNGFAAERMDELTRISNYLTANPYLIVFVVAVVVAAVFAVRLATLKDPDRPMVRRRRVRAAATARWIRSAKRKRRKKHG